MGESQRWIYPCKCSRIFRYDGTENGVEQLWGQAVCTHVLQYYAFGRIPTGIGNQAIVQIAASQEEKGGTTYWNWYGFGSRVEWCACFVSWCADQSGYIQSGVIPKFSLCSDGVKWFESKGRFRGRQLYPGGRRYYFL